MAAENKTFFSAQSMAANANSSAFAADAVRGGHVQVVWSGADANDSVVQLQVSLKPNPGASDWSDVPSKSLTLDAAAGAKFLDVGTLRCLWARLVYAKNAVTTGSLTALARFTDY